MIRYTPTQVFLATLQEILERLPSEPNQPKTVLALTDPVDGRTHQLELTPDQLEWLGDAITAYEGESAGDRPG